MRGYVGVTPLEIRSFIESPTKEIVGLLFVTEAMRSDETDEEELEFELSLRAASASRKNQGSSSRRGFVLAVEVYPTEAPTWSSVEAILISESNEPELSWYAPQEVETFLSQWLA